MKSITVIGGGVAGLVAALLAARKGHRVTLVESAKECGGLLASFAGSDGHEYDHGTHLLRDTGVAPLDQLLFGDLRADAWQRLPYLKNGAYVAGSYSGRTGSPNANALPRATYERGLAEMLDRVPSRHQPVTAHEFLLGRFGETFTRHIFEPALRKFCGCAPEDLAASAPSLFGMGRLVVSTPEATRTLKQSPHLDAVCAFHDSDEGLSGLTNYYPARGGIGQWVQALEDGLTAHGVSIHRGVHVAAVSRRDRQITAMTLSDGRTLAADQFIWTVNAALLVKQASLGALSFKPRFRKSVLYCFAFDRPFRTDSYFFVCYDPDFHTFRTTLYSNLRSDPSERAHASCCVEVFCDADAPEPDDAVIAGEQMTMGIVESDARWTLVAKKSIPMGFPVMTPQFVRASEELATLVESNLDNVLLLGKASGAAFLMNTVLSHAYEAIEQRI